MRSVFIDTNVLIYTRDAASPKKAARAAMWLESLAEREEAVISPQVVSEFVAVSLRRFPQASVEQVHASAHELLPLCLAPLDVATIVAAMRVHAEHATSWWDALIVGSASNAGCRLLLSEDLQAGMRFGALTVVNPFETEPQAVLDTN